MTGRTLRSVDDYMAGLEPHAAHIVQQVRALIGEFAPDMKEDVKYGMPVFSYAATYLYVGAWKKHLGLYPVYPAEASLEARIAPYRAGKDTVRFPYKHPIPFDLIAEIAKARIGAAADRHGPPSQI